MLPFGVTIPATVPQRSEIPEGLMNYPVLQIKLLLLMLAITNAATTESHCYTDKDIRPLIILHEKVFINVTIYIQRKTKPCNIT